MAGQHIAQEDRYEATGMTTIQRDKKIAELHRRGLSQHTIAKRLGITQPAVHYALLRLSGKERPRTKYNQCEWCDARVPAGTLINGCCDECANG